MDQSLSQGHQGGVGREANVAAQQTEAQVGPSQLGGIVGGTNGAASTRHEEQEERETQDGKGKGKGTGQQGHERNPTGDEV